MRAVVHQTAQVVVVALRDQPALRDDEHARTEPGHLIEHVARNEHTPAFVTEAVEKTLAAVRAAAVSGENMMPSIMEAVTAYATVVEIMGALKAEFGTFKEPVRF